MRFLKERLLLGRRRVADERGSVGILMALVIFTIVGMLMMTWNTVQLSKEKMRLQSAVDSAALAHCVWQARGLNTVQNINDEMYVSLNVAHKLLIAAASIEAMAVGCDALSGVPFVGWAMAAFAQAFHIAALLLGGTSGWLATKVCPYVLDPLSKFYVYGSCALGYYSAMQLAMKNRADPLIGSISLGGLGTLGIYAYGISMKPADTFVLPVNKLDRDLGLPWVNEADMTHAFSLGGFYARIHKVVGTGRPWSFKPWVSEGYQSETEIGRTPAPSIWIAHKFYNHIETLPLDVWKKDFSSSGVRKMPMFAMAAAKCVAGDVIPHTKSPEKGKVAQRAAGFGVGATAKLIPVYSVVSNNFFKKAVQAIVYH